MEKTNLPIFSVSDLLASINQTLAYAYPSVEVEGEVASFKVNQGKYVFFDVKDSEGSINCFMTVWQLRVPIEDGMKVIVTAQPKITAWGKFSLTVSSIRPSGEGAIKKSFQILKAKLASEGLFAEERKRGLPAIPSYVGVISSTGAAGYVDFCKIINDRWGGMKVDVANVQVQGASAPDQMIRALNYFNQLETLPEVIVIIRGGGSADDLSAFNDEPLVRAIAASRVPVLTGIGHEVDESLADLVADKRAATPSNAAQILVPDKHEIIRMNNYRMSNLPFNILKLIDHLKDDIKNSVDSLIDNLFDIVDRRLVEVKSLSNRLSELNPLKVLERGYAIVRGKKSPGSTIEIELMKSIIKAEVKNVTDK